MFFVTEEIVETRTSDTGIDDLIVREAFVHVVPKSEGGASGKNDSSFLVRQFFSFFDNPTHLAVVILTTLPRGDRGN